MDEIEKEQLIAEEPSTSRFIRKLSGSSEFIRGNKRYCLWIEDAHLSEALSIEAIKNRVSETKSFREKSKDAGARELSKRPHQFRDFKAITNHAIVVPRVSSDRRLFFPVGYLSHDWVILDSAQAIYEPTPEVMGILSSSMHLAWVKAVAGRLKNDFRYSSVLCWNTFPFPKISDRKRLEISDAVMDVISARESNSNMSISELYDPSKMPPSLLGAHTKLDTVIDQIYGVEGFQTVEDRLEVLFKLYKKMTGGHDA